MEPKAQKCNETWHVRCDKITLRLRDNEEEEQNQMKYKALQNSGSAISTNTATG